MVRAFLNRLFNDDKGRWGRPINSALTARARCIVVGIACLGLPGLARACPSLDAYYPTSGSSWQTLLPALTLLMPECLDSPEYFALLGAAQLNTNNIPQALESLERSLLLSPNNGAAQVDYAQALYSAGQIFPALEITQALLLREDLPPNLLTTLQERQQLWQSQTRSRGLVAEMAAGFDNNLNGAPSQSNFTLTLSGEPVALTLDSLYQPISGPYANVRIAGFYQQQAPTHTHDWLFAARNRSSQDSNSELLQFDWRYALALPVRRNQWELTAGTSHLMYGGSPLYSVFESRAKFRVRREGCQPYYELATQYQFYHGQNQLNGLESSAATGLECGLAQQQQLGVEAGVLHNEAIDQARLGANRGGWKVALRWQMQLGVGALAAQFGYTTLNDAQGYSDILANGASRQINSRYLQLQYSRPILQNLSIMVNVNHQGQGSNIEPFVSQNTAVEVGFRVNL